MCFLKWDMTALGNIYHRVGLTLSASTV